MSRNPLRFRNFSQVVLSLITAFILCSVLCTCRSRDAHTIAIIPATTGTELWESVHGGAEIAARRAGFRIYWNGPTREDDVAEQIALLEKKIDKGQYAGLVIAPTNYLALVGSVQKALSHQIPTVIIRSSLPIPPRRGLSYILNDDRDVGRLAAERIGTLLGGKGKVAVLGVDRFCPESILRARAFKSELGKRFPLVSVIEYAASSNAAEVQQRAQEILVDNPRIGAMLTLDEIATEGTWAALAGLGKSRKVKLVGCGQALDLMAAVRRGEIDSIIVENTREMGSLAVQWIATQREGKYVPGRIELKPVLVTEANIDNAEIQKMLSLNW